MEEGAHLGHLSYRPAPQPGDKCPPPCFRVLFGKVQQCSILRDPTTGDLKSQYLQAGVTALSVPPPLFFQQYMKKSLFFVCVFKGTHDLLGGGGGGTCPSAPPPPPSIESGTVGRRFNITAKIELICLTRPSIRSGSLFQHNKMNNTILTKNVKSTKNSADRWKSHHWNLILRHVSSTKCYKRENGIQHW